MYTYYKQMESDILIAIQTDLAWENGSYFDFQTFPN